MSKGSDGGRRSAYEASRPPADDGPSRESGCVAQAFHVLIGSLINKVDDFGTRTRKNAVCATSICSMIAVLFTYPTLARMTVAESQSELHGWYAMSVSSGLRCRCQSCRT